MKTLIALTTLFLMTGCGSIGRLSDNLEYSHNVLWNQTVALKVYNIENKRIYLINFPETMKYTISEKTFKFDCQKSAEIGDTIFLADNEKLIPDLKRIKDEKMWKYIVSWCILSYISVPSIHEDEFGRTIFDNIQRNDFEIVKDCGHSKEFYIRNEAIKFYDKALNQSYDSLRVLTFISRDLSDPLMDIKIDSVLITQ